jgi:predicted amidophosphoribosyltransferase
MSFLAHAGGWDELLLGAAAVILLLMIRPRRRADGDEPAEGPCLYCGRHLPPGTERCPRCGFRARRAPATESPTGEGR